MAEPRIIQVNFVEIYPLITQSNVLLLDASDDSDSNDEYQMDVIGGLIETAVEEINAEDAPDDDDDDTADDADKDGDEEAEGKAVKKTISDMDSLLANYDRVRMAVIEPVC